MRNWRVISTVAAVVFAAIAGLLVWRYVDSADSRAEHNKGLVPVLVAKSRIVRGTVFDQALADRLFTTVKLPRDSLPPNRIAPATDAALLKLYKGKVAATDIFTGTPLVSDQFVPGSQITNTVSGAIPKGEEAITLSLDPAHAVGGLVAAGDKVNLLVSFASAGPIQGTTQFLLSGVTVLAVGSTTIVPPPSAGSGPGASTTTTVPAPATQPATLITLQVTPREAEQIVQATNVGSVYLSLDPPDFKPADFTSPPAIIGANLFDIPALRRVSGGG